MQPQHVCKTFSSTELQRTLELLSALLNFILQPLVVLWRWVTRRLDCSRLGSKIPGPPSSNLSSCLGIEEISSKGVFSYATKIYHKCTESFPLLRVYVGPYLLMFSDARADKEKVLTSYKHVYKGQFCKFLNPWLTTRFLTSKGGEWKSRRKALIPTFHFCIMEHFIPVFNSCSDELVRQFQKRAGAVGFDVCNAMKLLTMDVICEAAMGVKINAQTRNKSAFVTALNDILHLTSSRVVQPWLYLDFVYLFTDAGKKYKMSLDVVHRTTSKVIRERRKEFEKIENEIGSLSYDEIGRRRRVAFLDLLLLAERDGSLSNIDIRDEVDSFMFAGQEATHTALSFTIFSLSRHEDVQDKLVEELKGIFHSSQPLHPTSQQLSELKYLEMVIMESMRLYPPVPPILRSIKDDLTPLSASNVLPSGNFMLASQYGAHHNPKIFPEPTKFHPERFSPEKSVHLQPYAFLPFSARSRNCVGQRFAILEMKSVLAKIVWNFRILPEPEFEPDMRWEVVLKSSNGLRVQLEERHV